MKIKETVFKEIMESPVPPPEVGGIIGGRDDIITCYFADKGSKENCYDSYYPSTDLLNEQIAVWQSRGIEFYGIYHTHFAGDDGLSCSDRRYIVNIMQAMPPQVTWLYFPIVFRDGMLVYRALREKNTVKILPEEMEII
ncbi:hypothetical protein [Megamonas hypermegale]|uniref:hypothetical protein n=1 Tax=Megamonas hypermegale TaxID=158847 RepID=UPI0026F18959|nr:hypothetical protein [Megamonas hypermegale]